LISSCAQSRGSILLLGLYKERKIAGYPTNKWIGSGREAGQHVVGSGNSICRVSNIGHGKDGWMGGWIGGSLFGGVKLGVIYKEANKTQIQMNIQMNR
jgi:hypothetical protein